MIKSKSEKGITLTTLVVTIVVLLILAGVATSTGIEAIENTKFTRFKAELKIMQSHVNQWYEDCKPSVNAQNYDDTFSTNIQNKLTASGAVSATSEEEGNSEKVQKAQDTLNKANVPSANYGNYYLLEENTKNSLGIEGVSQEVLVSVKDRKVVSFLGLKYKNKMYYTIDDQSGEGIGDVYNVEYDKSKLINEELDININSTLQEEGRKCRINVDIQNKSPYIAKEKIYYGKRKDNGNVTSWENTENTSFILNDFGTYEIFVKDAAGNESEHKIYDYKIDFSTAFGRIEVIWLDKNNNIIDKPNPPKLGTNMSKVTWTKQNDGSWLEDSTPQEDWYNYVSKNGTEENLDSRWANAKLKVNNVDSYFVWIPRYAYRIKYYANEESDIVTGYCDGEGIREVGRNSDGTAKVITIGGKKQELDEGIQTVKYKGQSYIVHPTFTSAAVQNSADNGGGWDNELDGIWVGKYETSLRNSTISSVGSIYTYKTVPLVKSYKGGTIKWCYEQSKSFDTSKQSHLIKNSEWGAVAYLTHSQFGRNGHEISQNNNENGITGIGSESPTFTNTTTEYTNNAYNTPIGVNASTTGNVYGIYDLSGGLPEFIAAYNSKSNINENQSFAWQNRISDKYATAYSNTSYTNTGNIIYQVGKFGDATKEVYTTNTLNNNYLNWFNDNYGFLYYNYPYIKRGDQYNSSYSGIFYIFHSSGAGAECTSRIVLAMDYIN